MDDVSQKTTPIVSISFIWGLFVAMSMGIVQEWLGFEFYDEIHQQWLPPFHLPMLRFGIRETIVYLNLWTGYAMLKRIHPNTPLPIFFAIFTIVLDVFFICSGVSRLLLPNFTPLVKQYGNIFYYLTTGILFVFFHALGIAWPTLNTTLFKEK
jgi:hypothetical protein